MGENKEKAPKTSWFSGLKAEFKKIIWPERKSLTKQTVAVVAVSVPVFPYITHARGFVYVVWV